MTAICYCIVIEKTHSQNTTFILRPFVEYVWILPRKGPRFELQLLRDRQEAARVVGGV